MADETNIETNKITIGMGGWELQPFDGVFYPAKPEKGSRKLEYFSRFFNMVEVNATFYNTSFSPAQIQRWLKDVGENKEFIFTIKLYRGFTHTYDATKNDALTIHRFLEPLRNSGKLGGLVIQFPSSFDRSNKRQSYLVKLRAMFPEDSLFLDLRHRSWGDDSVFEFCRDKGINLINVDLPRLPNHIPFYAHAWNGVAYFRMMGRNAETWNDFKGGDRYLYFYSEEELQDLVRRIKQVNALKTYVIFHNDRQGFSLVNGRQVEHTLYPTRRLIAPANLLAAFPQLKSFCDLPVTEGALFPESNLRQ